MSENKSGTPSRFGDEEWRIVMPEDEPASKLPAMRVAPDKRHTHAAIARAVRSILESVGEDPTREGLLKTPDRVARAYDELLEGYTMDPAALVNGALFESDYQQMVVVQEIAFYSMCEHHMLPFFGQVHVAYIPNGKVIGLSKIPRVVDMYARRLQLQERMTGQIADFLQEVLRPRGVAVIVSGQHLCSMMRGVNKAGARMTTQVLRGAFENAEVRAQLREHLRQTG